MAPKRKRWCVSDRERERSTERCLANYRRVRRHMWLYSLKAKEDKVWNENKSFPISFVDVGKERKHLGIAV